MKPKDKFGKPIYSHVYSILKKNESILLKLGYLESRKHPNLFFKKIKQGWLNADMRGTEEVPIWSDTNPLFFWSFDTNIPLWERRRVIKQELTKLREAGCPCRLSFHYYETTEFEKTNVYMDEKEGIYEWDDGFCRFCSKDFQKDGSYCSLDCEQKFIETLKTPCQVCGNKIDLYHEVRHHISYFPEKVIFVHASCHNKIHKTDLYPGLKPCKDEINKYYKKS
jgi:hypothetical protein